jgi:hypothetical protein
MAKVIPGTWTLNEEPAPVRAERSESRLRSVPLALEDDVVASELEDAAPLRKAHESLRYAEVLSVAVLAEKDRAPASHRAIVGSAEVADARRNVRTAELGRPEPPTGAVRNVESRG